MFPRRALCLVSLKNHMKPKNRIAVMTVRQPRCLHNILDRDSITFQAGVHSARDTTLSIRIRTVFTDIAGLCGKNKHFITIRLQKLSDHDCNGFMRHAGVQKFLHIHNIAHLCH